VDYGQSAISIRAEYQVRHWIEPVCIYAIADWDGCHNLSGVGVHHHQFSIATTDKEAVMGGIDCHSRRVLTGCQRPAVQDPKVSRIDLNDFVFVFKIVVDMTATIGRCELWAAAKFSASRDRASRRIDCCDFAVAAEDEDSL
jgi:hypothetical protein